MTEPTIESLIAAYQHIDSSTIGHLTEQGYLAGIKPVLPCTQSLAGRVLTVRLNSDNTDAINEALRSAHPKDILCIDAQLLKNKACWGALRTCAAIYEQLIAVIVLGEVTDSQALKQLDFPVFAQGISSLTTANREGRQGEIKSDLYYQLPDDRATVCIKTGDLAVLDNDGVFVLSVSQANALLVRCQQKQQSDDTKLQLFMDAYKNNQLDQLVDRLKPQTTNDIKD